MSVAHGPITQTAWVVPDIEAGERFLDAVLGTRKWTRLPDVPFTPETCVYLGEPADFTAHISLSYSGEMQLELIQPVRGNSIFTRFLEHHGPGLHHICLEPSDFDAALEEAAAQHIPTVMHGGITGQLRFAYLDGSAAGIPFIELAEVGPSARALFEQIKAASA